MISLIIPTYRNPKYLDICLKSATENKVLDSTEIIVIVDGFYDESKEVLEKYPSTSVLDLGSNLGMQAAINMGVMVATNEYMFIINDDNVLPIEWDMRIMDSIEYNAAIGEKVIWAIDQVEPTGPSIYNFHIENMGTTVETFDYDKWIDYELSIRNDTVEFRTPIFPFIVTKKHFMAVGGFDTFYDSPHWCDIDYFMKYELLGFKFVRLHDLHLYHFGSVATKKNSERDSFITREIDAAGQFNYKWGFVPNLIQIEQNKQDHRFPKNTPIKGITQWTKDSD